MNKVLCIIPARGGSKGIPRKNLKLLAGKPLLAHSILHAKQTPSIARIVVSTDDDEIAAVAREWGAEVVPRPPEISGDKASSESALLHTLDTLQSTPELQVSGLRSHPSPPAPQASGFSPQPSAPSPSSDLRPLTSVLYQPDLVVFLQATSPMRAPDDIQRAIETLKRDGADSLLSVGPVHGFVWRVEKDGSTRSFSYDHLHRPRRQDAPEDLIENGSLYIFKPWVLRKYNNRLGGKIALHRMSVLDSFQIDEPGDFELLEALMAFRNVEQKAESRKQKAEIGEASPISAFQKIRLLVLDFDGVLTDNRVLVSEDGKEAVLCNRSDSLGLGMLKAKGVEVVVISKEKNPVVTARCQKLGLECIQGCDDKLAALKEKAGGGKQPSEVGERLHGPRKAESRKQKSERGKGKAERGMLKAEEIAYVGNDVNDLDCMRWVGMPIAVADAMPEAKSAAKWVTSLPGGHGAVREVCDLLLTAKSRK
jgi:CMP-N-acetylneuraminic acid synthetase/3-deoxy-D-manno-octulosonate 8-phosphate phosphatase KdsC-like HAD superfamily phosphatase